MPWLAAKEPPMLSPAAWHRYKNAVDKFLVFLGDSARSDIAYVTKQNITDFVLFVAKKHSLSTANTDLKILSSAFRYAVGDGLRLDNPCNLISKLPRGSSKRRRPFTVEEIKKLLAVANEEWRGIILFGLYTGLRLGDIVSLKWREIAGNILNMDTNKTGRPVDVPLVAPVQRYLAMLAKGRPSDLVFPLAASKKAAAEGNTRRLSAQFHNLLVSAGLAHTRSKKNTGRGHSTSRTPSELSFHCLRHTTTSWLKRANVADGLVMDIVGHDTVEASGIYTKYDEPSKRTALEKLPEVF